MTAQGESSLRSASDEAELLGALEEAGTQVGLGPLAALALHVVASELLDATRGRPRRARWSTPERDGRSGVVLELTLPIEGAEDRRAVLAALAQRAMRLPSTLEGAVDEVGEPAAIRVWVSATRPPSAASDSEPWRVPAAEAPSSDPSLTMRRRAAAALETIELQRAELARLRSELDDTSRGVQGLFAELSAYSAQLDRAEGGGIDVLLVEDDEDARELLGARLRRHGLSVEEAADGPEALDRMRRGPLPEVVVADVGLPGMDGYALARSIRSDPRLRSVTLVALTGYAGDAAARRAAEAGFDVHLVKPIAVDALLAALERAP